MDNEDMNRCGASEDMAAWYEGRRNELLEMLEKVLDLQLSEEARRRLVPVKKKCKENQFEIVLSGEFQGGKSTTFNALCDGRDLSPRGLGGGGIKTSAAAVSAQNISDGETRNGMEEWAEITFKTKEELAQVMFDLVHGDLAADEGLRRHLSGKLRTSEDEIEKQLTFLESFARCIDLDDEVCCDAVNRMLKAYWQEYEENKADFDGARKDQLRIATLIMRFYNNAEMQKIRSRDILGIFDYQELIRFPEHWEKMWSKGMSAEFTAGESAFVFVKRVLLRIHSPNLERVGCRITDCPGLFANYYDTKVAMQAFREADAVWYLFNGGKQIGEQDLKCLKEIRRVCDISRIVCSANLKGNTHKKIINGILPVSEKILEDNGFEQKPIPYNARLAFLAEQGERLLHQGKLSAYELDCLAADYRGAQDNEDDDDDCGGKTAPTAPGEQWTEIVKSMGYAIGSKDLKNAGGLDGTTVSAVLEKSRLNTVLDSLNRKIINSKAPNILIDKGSREAVSALMEYEGKLRNVEEAAEKEEQQCKDEFEERKRVLQEFVDDSVAGIEKLERKTLNGALVTNLSRDIVEQLFRGDESLPHELGRIIMESVTSLNAKFYWRKKTFIKDVENDVMPKIASYMASCGLGVLNSWQKAQGIGKNWDAFILDVNEQCQEIEQRLAEVKFQNKFETPLLRLDGVYEAEKQLKSVVIVFCDSSFWHNLAGVLRGNFFLRILSGIMNFIGRVATKAEIVNKAKKKLDDVEGKILVNDIKQQLDHHMNDEKVLSPLREVFKEAVEGVFDEMIERVSSLAQRYNNEFVVPALKAHEYSRNERQDTAEQNRRIREGQIEPVRRKLEEFERTVETELSGKGAKA